MPDTQALTIALLMTAKKTIGFALMADKTKELLQQIETLTQENDILRSTCDNLMATVEALETTIAEAGGKQLQAEIDNLQLLQIFSAATDPIWVIQDDGLVIRANDAMLDFLNKSNSEVIGTQCCELLNYGHCGSNNCPLKKNRRHKVQEYEIQLDDEYYLVSTAPLTTIVGSYAIVAQFKNITARKEAEKAREELNRRLTEMANIDGLTRIANRRYLDEILLKEWGRQQRNGTPLSLILLDIDFFKRYNDRYGHSAGDECLVKVAAALKSSLCRSADLAARYGGEEFALLLPEIPIDGAVTVAKRIAEAIHDLQIPHQDSEASDFVTVSQGVASILPSAETSPLDLINMADKALYQVKEQGRNSFSTF